MKKTQALLGFLTKRVRLLFLLFIAIVASWASLEKMSHDRWRYAIFMDGRGYYSYLPALFIYNDPSCSFYAKASENQPDSANFINYINGKPVNKYYCGEALLQIPFFATAHLVASIFDYKTSGYSEPYQYGVAVAGIFYFLVGLFFLWKLLEKFGFRKRVILFVCFCFAVGTNLFHYAAYEPSMSHVYSFAAITAFLFFTRSFFLSPNRKTLILSGILLALVALLRPVNLVIFLAFPLMAGNMENLKASIVWVKKNVFSLGFVFVLFLLICFIQPLIYYWETGHFFIWSYSEEGFDFLHPHIYGTLFSFEKGLFIYTPLTFLSLFGLVVIFRRSPYIFLSITSLLGIIIFIVSSWHEWKYGFCFGLRAYVEYYALFALCFAFLIDAAFSKKVMSIFLLLTSSALIVIYNIQQYQFEHRILHPGSMNEERYWLVFLHTDKKYEDTLFHLPVVLESEGNFNDMEGSVDWPGLETIIKGPAYSGKHSSRIDSLSPYSVGFCRNMSDDEIFDLPYRVKISAWVMRKDSGDKAEIVIVQTKNDSVFFSKNISLPPFRKSGLWENVKHELILPGRKTKDQLFRVFFFSNKGEVYIDDLEIELEEGK